MKVSIIIPTLNAETSIKNVIKKIKEVRPEDEILIIDSSSTDDTVKVAQDLGAKTVIIPRKEFNHGGTRNKAVKIAGGDILIFLTQDAFPANQETIVRILTPFSNPEIGMAYGRQLPHEGAGVFGSFARLFNYPEHSVVKSMEDAHRLGIKTVFCSNSFAAYRRETLEKVGGFPVNTILAEDTFVAAKMVLAGYSIAYVADAQVFHSHDYTITQEFKRYFDIGVFYGRESWIVDRFEKAEGEGAKYVKEEIKYLLQKGKLYLLPSSIMRNAAKLLGYKLGMIEKKLPLSVKKKLSMHKLYWG